MRLVNADITGVAICGEVTQPLIVPRLSKLYMAYQITLACCGEVTKSMARLPVATGCAYTVPQIGQRPEICSAVYGTVHCKEPWKSFDKSRA